MTTSEERRRAAELMRNEAADFRRIGEEYSDAWTVDLVDVSAIFQDITHYMGLDGIVRDDTIFDRIADFIDPTCEMEPMPACVPHHRFSRWRCRKCGLVSFTPFNATGPRYCPYCGHRWVTRDDQR